MKRMNSPTWWRCYLLLGILYLSPSTLAGVECTERPDCWPEGSAMHTGLVLAQQLKTIEKRLALKHKELMAMVGSATPANVTIERVVQALENQQQTWLRYKTEECELIGALTGAGGSWPSTHAVRCEVNLTDLRLRSVRYALRCVTTLPEETRGYEQSRCLQQLAPLVNG